MTPRAPGPFGPNPKASRIEELFADVARFADQGRPRAALRAADCARRLAPGNPTCLLVHAGLLIRVGEAAEAASQLRGRDEPDAVVARAEALCMQGSLDEAGLCAGTLLRRYAVNAVENLQRLAARLCRMQSELPGWVGVDTSLRIVGEVRTGHHVIASAGAACFPAVLLRSHGGFDSFHCDVPSRFSGRIRFRTREGELLGSEVEWPPDFGVDGWVVAEDQRLVGKVRMQWAPALPLNLAIGRGEGLVRLPAGTADSAGSTFSFPLDRFPDVSRLEVAAELPNGDYLPLAGSPLRTKPVSSTPIATRPPRIPTQPSREPGSKIIDIVVPVYAGLEETLACLQSVLATTTPGQAELVVINDAAPDVALCDALARLAEEGRITLLANQSNLGFPGSVNRGIGLHPERDVVVLNSDTAVSGDWLARLKSAAYRATDIGTVTPLGEQASIMTYRPAAESTDTVTDTAAIDGIAREVNARNLAELPVGVGFCLYIRRDCLGEAGEFDEDAFGKGYGEENDFCLRARRLGWRHVGAVDVYVGHRGARSYGRTKEVLTERNRRVLNALHPGYDRMIADFIAADPLLEARRAIDMRRLLSDVHDPVLLVTLDLPGGVSRHIDLRQTELRAAGHTVLILRPAGTPGRIHQTVLSTPDHHLENLAWNLPEETGVLRAFVSELGLSGIELHHFFGLPAAALDLVASLDVPYQVFVHDYSWICPRVTLVGGNGVYCGEPSIEDCETCIRTHGTALEDSLTVADLRARSARILRGADTVVAPTEDVRARVVRYFPDLPIQVAGWERPVESEPRCMPALGERIRVAVIGAIGLQKGHQVLLECARDAAGRDLNIDFIVIGYTSDDEPLLATGRVWITGPYAESEIDALLKREQCHVALYASVAPETWCYALSHALRWALPVVAFNMGAIAERLRTRAATDLLPLSATPREINDSLLRLARTVTTSDVRKELAMNNTPPVHEPPVSRELESSTKVLKLPAGVYAFTVQDGAAEIPSDEIAAPALQVGLAPVKSAGSVEFLAGAATLDRWLTRSTDTIIARISGGDASLLLTSVRWPDSSALAIKIQRLESELPTVTPGTGDGPAVSDNAQAVLAVRMLTHVRNFGDVQFNDGWAGFIGGNLWTEAFAVISVGEAGADPIEYRGVTQDGFETPWLTNQTLCGSRGRGMPLTGFAFRVKGDLREHYDCAYSGRFVSGVTVGPLRDGAMCCSDSPGDPLEGIDVRVIALHARAHGAGSGDPG